ncbi:MAG: hypothetical protein ACRCXB_17935 [Aeromonadaceae bacterium]
MRDVFEDLKPFALKAKIMPWEYWELTYGEIVEVVQCVIANEEREFKQQALLTHTLGYLITVGTGAVLGDGKYPEIEEVFPSLGFARPKEQAQEEDWKRMLRGFSMLAEAYNARR